MQPVPSSRNPLRLLLQRPSDQGEPSLLIKKPVHCTGFLLAHAEHATASHFLKTITISSQRQISARSCWNLTSL